MIPQPFRRDVFGCDLLNEEVVLVLIENLEIAVSLIDRQDRRLSDPCNDPRTRQPGRRNLNGKMEFRMVSAIPAILLVLRDLGQGEFVTPDRR